MISLKKPDLRNVPVGTEVETSKGFIFKLIYRDNLGPETWEDIASRIQWQTPIKDRLNWNDAMAKYPGQLPTKEEFEVAEEHGFREILGIESGWFWSSSPRGADCAFYFSGYYGNFDYFYRSFYNFYEAVVCVASR